MLNQVSADFINIALSKFNKDSSCTSSYTGGLAGTLSRLDTGAFEVSNYHNPVPSAKITSEILGPRRFSRADCLGEHAPHDLSAAITVTPGAW